MYKIIGADGKEYEADSVAELRQWMTDGRADARTLVCAAGASVWVPLGNLPEFADPERTNAPPRLPPAAFKGGAPTGGNLAGQGQLPVVDCLKGGWKLLRSNFGLLFSAGVLIGVIQALLSRLPVLGAVALLFSGVFSGGLYMVFLKRLRGNPATLAEAFSGFGENFVQLLLVGIVSLLLTYVAFCFCVLPCIYLYVAWALAVPLVADKQMGFWDALELSRKVVSANWFRMALLLLVAFLPVLALAVYADVRALDYLSVVKQNGQFDPGLLTTDPAAYMAQLTRVSHDFEQKFYGLRWWQQLVFVLVLPYATAVLTQAYEVLFNPRSARTT
jgi:hypothetical protein